MVNKILRRSLKYLFPFTLKEIPYTTFTLQYGQSQKLWRPSLLLAGAWWHTPLTLALMRQGYVDLCEFMSSLVHTASLRPAWCITLQTTVIGFTKSESILGRPHLNRQACKNKVKVKTAAPASLEEDSKGPCYELLVERRSLYKLRASILQGRKLKSQQL